MPMQPFVMLFLLLALPGKLLPPHLFADEPLTLWATHYHTPVLDHDPKGIPLLDREARPTGLRLSPCDWCRAAIEGSVHVRKDEQVHVMGYAARAAKRQHDCRSCARYQDYDGYEKTGRVLWQRSTGFGHGVRHYKLVPLVTVAVDPALIPFGTVLFIPEAEGVMVRHPDGGTRPHDGYFFAGDTGSKITGNHIDVFLGLSEDNPFPFVQSTADSTFQAFLVEDEAIRERLEALHR